jgi:Zn-dependent protease with chaperone function
MRPMRAAGRLAHLDSANRSFFALTSIALVPYVLLGLFGCGVLSVAAYRLADDGLAGLNQDGQDLRPAVAFFAIVTAGTVAAAVSVRHQIRATRALASALDQQRLATPDAVTAAARQVGLGSRVVVIDDPYPFSFTYGLRSPRVAVSRVLVETLSPDQVAAVLHHERYHLRNRDTLKMVVARAASVAFFFLPALPHLRTRYLAGRELAADRAALDTVGTRPLAGALFQVLESSTPSNFGAAAALGGAEFLDLRVHQLETGNEPQLGRLPRWRLAVTVAGLTLLTTAFALTATSTNGAADMMGRPDRPGGTAIAVLGGVLCMITWVLLGLFVLRRVIGHHRLTLRPTRTTTPG